MGRTRKKDEAAYFDRETVNAVDGLFAVGAQARDETGPIFLSRGNNKTMPAEVRKLFGISPNDISIWRKGEWHKREATWWVSFVDRLISIFSGDHARLVPSLQRAKAELVVGHWRSVCPDDLTDTVKILKVHREAVAKAVTERTLKGGSKPALSPIDDVPTPESGSIAPDAMTMDVPFVPIDLTPPKFSNSVPRPKDFAALSIFAAEHFAAIIEGRLRSGKRYLARQYIEAQSATRCLWFDLAPSSEFQDVLTALAFANPPLHARVDLAIGNLAAWLRSTNTILVLAGLDPGNVSTFIPMLQTLSRLAGPCRLLATSSVRTEGTNAFELGGLSGDETVAFLSLIGTSFDAGEMHLLAKQTQLTPFSLRQAAVRFGSVSPEHLAALEDASRLSLVARLPEELRPVHEVLQVLNVELDVAVVAELLRALNIDRAPIEVLNEFERMMLVRRITAHSWRLDSGEAESVGRYIGIDELRAVLVQLAIFYRAQVERHGRMPDALNNRQCLHLFAACRLLQLAESDWRQRRWLKSRFAAPMERKGAHRQLLPIYEYETASSSDLWEAFSYARCLFVVGHLNQALRVLDDLLHDLFEDRGHHDQGLHLSAARLLSEILIETGHPALAVRIADAALEHADVANITASICTSTVSVLSWALVRAGMPEACIALNDEILDRNFRGLAPPFSRQIAAIRVGVAKRDLGQLRESVELLKGARNYFAVEDARAFAWSAAQLAVSLDAEGDVEGAERALRSAIEVNASHDLANGEALRTYRLFLGADAFPNLQHALQAEIERLEGFEREWTTVSERLPRLRIVTHALLQLDIDLATPYEFDLKKYELLSFASPHAIASPFNRSLVKGLRKADIEATLDNIFAANTPEAIFQRHLYNRVIVEACRDSVVLIKKFVTPFLEAIGERSDSIIFLYARLLEGAGKCNQAQELLAKVGNKEAFSYHNILANCLSHDDPLGALEQNDVALKYAQRRQQRAQIFHNKAAIVYENRIRHRFADARLWCEEAIREADKPGFVWPRNLLLKLKLAECPLDQVEATIRVHQTRFRAPLPKLAEILADLEPKRLREAALSALTAMADRLEH